jgi:general stress protein YciG
MAETVAAPKKTAKKAKRKKDREFFQAIGRKGGQKTREKYGSEFFSSIGKRGGTALKEEKGIEFFRKIARISRQKVGAAAEGAEATAE